jgi:DNA-binding IclR family transcriptional regulator
MNEHPMRVIANARAAIDLLASRGPLSPSALGEALGIPRGTAYRLASGLHAIDFTEPLAGGSIGLSRRWLRLADAAAASLTEWMDSHHALANIVKATGHTAFLTVPRGDSALCIDSVLGQASEVWVIRRGLTFPLNAGPGRQFLAYWDDLDLQEGAFSRLTDKTLFTEAELETDARMTATRGYLIAQEDVMPRMTLIGFPVFGQNGVIHGCIALGGGTASILSDEDRLVDILRTAAAHLTRAL